MDNGTRAILVLMFATSLASSPAGAAERFVHRRGSDLGNDCLAASNPCATIGRAFSQSASGDTINVARGGYKENVLIDFSTNLTLLGGWDPAFTVRDPSRYRTKLKAHRVYAPGRTLDLSAGPGEVIDVTLDGFTMKGAPVRSYEIVTSGGLGATADGGSVTLTVRDSTINKCKSEHLIDRGGGLGEFARNGGTVDVTLRDVTLTGNRTRGGAAAIYVLAESGGTATLSLVNSVVRGSPLLGGNPAVNVGGLGVGSTTTLTLLNSTVTDNDFAEGVVLVNYGDASITGTLTNNILWGNGASDLHLGGFMGGTVTANADHNNIGTVVGSTYNDLGGNLSVDPLLDGFARLRAGSPMIDAGTCTGVVPTDIDGDPRPSGGGCDIGADEFAP